MLRALLTLLLALAIALAGGAAPSSAELAPAPPVEHGSVLPPVAGGSANVADPAGGPAWRVRAGRAEDGRTCVTLAHLGRTLAGRCARLRGRQDTASFVIVRGRRTMVVGVAAPGVRRVELLGAHARELRMTRRGRAYAAVLGGRFEHLALPVRTVLRDGGELIEDWGAASTVEARDPYGARRWLLQVNDPVRLRSACAVWASPADLPEIGGRVGSEGVCFDLTRSPFGVARLPMGIHGIDASRRVDRTVVLGVAGPQVRAVALLTAAGPVPLELSARGRGFLAVLAGDDPSPLQVTLADGSVITAAGAVAVGATIHM